MSLYQSADLLHQVSTGEFCATSEKGHASFPGQEVPQSDILVINVPVSASQQVVESQMLTQHEADCLQEQTILESTLETAYPFINDTSTITAQEKCMNSNTTDDQSHLPIVEVIEIDEEENIEFFSSAADQNDSGELLGLTQGSCSEGGSNDGGVVDRRGAKQTGCVVISPVSILQSEQLGEDEQLSLTEQNIVDADVASLSDFTFPEDPPVDGQQLINQISPTPDLLEHQRDFNVKKNRKQLNTTADDQPILPAKMHRRQKDEKVYTVPVGQGIKQFLATHPLVKGLYLNRGKRGVKKNLVSLERHNKAVDKGSWQRGHLCHARNRLDDHFIPTVEGKERVSLIQEKRIRDEYVVNWYLWCPGHGNCRRKCGGYGVCAPGK